MASAFWGGFAKTLGGLLQEEDNRAAEMDSYQKKLLFAKSLERNEEVDWDTGTKIIRDGTGKVVERRPLSNDEITQHRLGLDKAKAETEGTIAESGVKVKQAGHYEEDRAREIAKDKAKEARDNAYLSIAQQQAAQGRKSLEEASKAKSKNFTQADVFNAVTADSDIREMISLGGSTANAAIKAAIDTAVTEARSKGLDLATAVNIARTGIRASLGKRVYNVKNPPKDGENDALTSQILSSSKK